VFVPLLVSADAAFAQLLHDAALSGWPVDRAPARLLVAGGVLAVAGGLLHRAPRRPREPVAALARLDWALPLGALVAVFAGFVAVQLTTLFGGQRHVLRTAGLTYAEYARSGFAQLLVVAALTLAVIAAARRWARQETAADRRLLRGLLAAVCVLTLVVLASALKRLGLYEDAFGFTRARLAGEVVMLWLAALFCLLAAAGGRPWVPRAGVAISAGALLAFAAADPDRLVAEHDVDRYRSSGRIDVAYLSRLGPDAAPALARLPTPLAACATARLRATLARGDGLAGANLARWRARRALGPTPRSAPGCPRRPG
jgi:uncharacterized protein DUF4153